MVPGRNMPTAAAASMLGRNVGLVCYTPVTFGQQNLMDGQHQHQHQLPVLQQQYQNHVQQQQAATSESDALGQRQDELTMSGSENMDGGDGSGSAGEDLQEDPSLQRPRKKRYHRHTQHQIQELEAFFKQYPHPDDKQRKELSRELGLEPLQVKFWFQNKRTQMKTHQERQENFHLRAENERLRDENARCKEALANAACLNCGGPATAVIGEMSFDEQHLRLENVRLHDEIDRISSIAVKYVGKPAGSLPSSNNSSAATAGLYPSPSSNNSSAATAGLYPSPLSSSHHISGADMLALHHGAAGIDKPLVIELAVAAMEELVRMAQLDEPLWVPAVVDGVAKETLNEEEYGRSFPSGVGPKLPELRSEASRETVVVIMNHINLVEMLMDVMSAEFQMPSPLVPTRVTQSQSMAAEAKI